VIHDTLDQYTKIIEPSTRWWTDALARKRPVTVLNEIAKNERELAREVEKFTGHEGADVERYRFALERR